MSYKRAVQTAESILADIGCRIPVDVGEIAEAHAVFVAEQDLEDSVSGVLVIKESKGVIGVNANHHPNRQRFTVAHELGHFLLHRDAGRVFVDRSPVFFRDGESSEGTSQQEIEANSFAAALLMPETELRKLLNDHPIDAFDEMSVRRLAARLGVSVQALTIRLTRLGLVSEF